MTALELSQRINKTRTTVNVMNPGLIPTTGLFREFNPIFVAIFTFLTTKIFKVAATETEGGRRLAYLVESEEVNGINGKYFSGRPGSTSFSPIDVSVEANDQEKRKKLWNLSKTLVGI